MNFELLPIEIILDIFSYIDSIHLLRAFYGLNARFNYLLYKQYREYCFKFNNCSKDEFDLICQQHLPSITNQVLYLHLEDFPESPGQIELFFKYIQSINTFTYLRTLKFSKLCSDSILIQIINTLHYLINLTRLEFHSCKSQCNQVDSQSIMNQIWNLPNLIYLSLDIYFSYISNFILPTNISKSIKYLHIHDNHHKRNKFTYNEIQQLVHNTPSMKYLKIYLALNTYERHSQSYHFLSLTHLEITFSAVNDTTKILSFLQNLSNLRQLDVHLLCNIIDGYQWKRLIENSLPKLKVFKLVMSGLYILNPKIGEHADRLLNSFRTSFWINQHQWFVRCLVYDYQIILQSLPATFNDFSTLPSSWKSTDPNDDDQKYFDGLTSINFLVDAEQSNMSSVRLTNVNQLRVYLPIDDQFWSIIPTLKKLTSLTIGFYEDSFQSQLQTLLDHAPNLTHLDIYLFEAFRFQTLLLECTSTSVRNLKLIEPAYQLNEDECLALSRSSLVRQCEVLHIELTNRQCILILIQNMIDLKALYVKYGNEINIDEVIQWLHGRLPSTCFISKDLPSTNSIQIWIK